MLQTGTSRRSSARGQIAAGGRFLVTRTMVSRLRAGPVGAPATRASCRTVAARMIFERSSTAEQPPVRIARLCTARAAPRGRWVAAFTYERGDPEHIAPAVR